MWGKKWRGGDSGAIEIQVRRVGNVRHAENDQQGRQADREAREAKRLRAVSCLILCVPACLLSTLVPCTCLALPD